MFLYFELGTGLGLLVYLLPHVIDQHPCRHMHVLGDSKRNGTGEGLYFLKIRWLGRS